MRILKVQTVFLFITLLIGMTYTAAQCQTHSKFATAGTFELGGSLSYDAVYNSSSFSVSPFIGWFPIDGVEIGFDPIEYSTLVNQWPPNSYIFIRSQTNIMILFAPSYNLKITGRSFLFIEGLAGYTHVYENGLYSGPCDICSGPFTESDSGIVYGGHIGVKAAITNNCLFNIGVQYLRRVYSTSHSLTYGYNDISLVAGFTVVL